MFIFLHTNARLVYTNARFSNNHEQRQQDTRGSQNTWVHKVQEKGCGVSGKWKEGREARGVKESVPDEAQEEDKTASSLAILACERRTMRLHNSIHAGKSGAGGVGEIHRFGLGSTQPAM